MAIQFTCSSPQKRLCGIFHWLCQWPSISIPSFPVLSVIVTVNCFQLSGCSMILLAPNCCLLLSNTSPYLDITSRIFIQLLSSWYSCLSLIMYNQSLATQSVVHGPTASLSIMDVLFKKAVISGPTPGLFNLSLHFNQILRPSVYTLKFEKYWSIIKPLIVMELPLNFTITLNEVISITTHPSAHSMNIASSKKPSLTPK